MKPHLINIDHDFKWEIFDDETSQHEDKHNHAQQTDAAPEYLSSSRSEMEECLLGIITCYNLNWHCICLFVIDHMA